MSSVDFNEKIEEEMGKGDIKTKRGKIKAGSFGNTRQRKGKKAKAARK